MDVRQLDHAVNNRIIEDGTRVWLFGSSFRADIPVPQLCIPFTEAEIKTHFGQRNTYYRRDEYSVHAVSEKTGRVLSKEIVVHYSTADRGGSFNRSQHIEVFTDKDQAINAYQRYLAEQTDVINRIIAEETEKYNGWLARMQAPMANLAHEQEAL